MGKSLQCRVWEELKKRHGGCVVDWEKVVGDEVREMGRDSMMQAMKRNLDLSLYSGCH